MTAMWRTCIRKLPFCRTAARRNSDLAFTIRTPFPGGSDSARRHAGAHGRPQSDTDRKQKRRPLVAPALFSLPDVGSREDEMRQYLAAPTFALALQMLMRASPILGAALGAALLAGMPAQAQDD